MKGADLIEYIKQRPQLLCNDIRHINDVTEKYVLLSWPASQEFIGQERCYMCSEIDGAVFVPEDLLNKY